MKEFEKHDIDEIATQHINQFLAMYNLKRSYKIEHKRKNISSQIFYIKKSHYVLQIVEGELVYKVRGTVENDNPTYLQIARNVLENKSDMISLSTKTTRFNTLYDYKLSKKQYGKDVSTNLLIPGETRECVQEFHFTTLDMPYKKSKEYRERKKQFEDFSTIVQKQGFQTAYQKRLKEFETSHSKY